MINYDDVPEIDLKSLADGPARQSHKVDLGMSAGTDAVIIMRGISAEEMVRLLLVQAIEDKLVTPAFSEWDNPDPRDRTTGELVGMANLLMAFLD